MEGNVTRVSLTWRNGELDAAPPVVIAARAEAFTATRDGTRFLVVKTSGDDPPPNAEVVVRWTPPK